MTSAKKEGGGSGQNHDLRFLSNSDKSQRGGGPKEMSLFTKCPYVCFRGNYNQDHSLNKSIYNLSTLKIIILTYQNHPIKIDSK